MTFLSTKRSVVSTLRCLVFAIFCSALLAGCFDTRGGVAPYNPQGFGEPDQATVQRGDDGKIGPLDTISVSVFQLADLNRDAQVDANGNINLPLLGAIHAEGKTTDQLRTEIKGLLAAKYIRDPDVQVVLKESGAQTITVEGAVTQPGVFPISGETTLITAVALARGTTPAANPRRVVVFRNIDGKRNAAAFDLQEIRRAKAEDPKIYGNDIIVVDGSASKGQFQDLIKTVPLLALFRPF